MTSEQEIAIELLIDRHGLKAVLESISGICQAKSEYILSNCNDMQLALKWDLIRARIDRCVADVEVVG